MKEHPILFSGEMVRAILEGRKTQTRRVIKPEPVGCDECGIVWHKGNRSIIAPDAERFALMMTRRCPYGRAGDELWVRETHHIDWYPDGALDARGNPGTVHYRADTDVISQSWDGQWRPSIFMPRWASRITLEVTGVRVERVQNISIGDIRAEGIEKQFDWVSYDMIMAFRELWDSINAQRTIIHEWEDDQGTIHRDEVPGGYSWDSNPWVWVVEFRQI